MPLTRNETKTLSHLIEQRREALLAELREDAARSREHPYAEHAGPAPDSGDQSVASLFADLEPGALSRDLDESRALEAERDGLQGGDCGVCVACGNDVGFERLMTCAPP